MGTYLNTDSAVRMSGFAIGFIPAVLCRDALEFPLTTMLRGGICG